MSRTVGGSSTHTRGGGGGGGASWHPANVALADHIRELAAAPGVGDGASINYRRAARGLAAHPVLVTDRATALTVHGVGAVTATAVAVYLRNHPPGGGGGAGGGPAKQSLYYNTF